SGPRPRRGGSEPIRGLQPRGRAADDVRTLSLLAVHQYKMTLLTRIRQLLSVRRHPVAVVTGSVVVVFSAAVLLGDVAGHAPLLHTLRGVTPEWFALCFVAQAVAYVGYVFALRETARVDDGPRLDYRALRHAGASRREALKRVFGLGTLEYAVLAPAAMFSAIAILADASDHV